MLPAGPAPGVPGTPLPPGLLQPQQGVQVEPAEGIPSAAAPAWCAGSAGAQQYSTYVLRGQGGGEDYMLLLPFSPIAYLILPSV